MGGDSSFGNSGSAVTIITMVGHVMGTIGLVVGKGRGKRVGFLHSLKNQALEG